VPTSSLGYDDTPFLPGGKWRVHDGNRPQPPVVTPAAEPGGPPSDAVVLFDGTSLDAWVSVAGGPARWKVENGYMEVVPGTGDIQTLAEFGDAQIHLELCEPAEVKGEGQGRGNSGVFLMGRYEIQVLDCYNNLTYADGTSAAIYGQYPPLVNACRPPGEWSTYDIIWETPRWENGQLIKPAYVTVLFNGIVVHNHRRLLGYTSHRVLTEYVEHPPVGPLRLQDHGDLVRFRNIWYRPLVGYEEE